MAINNWLGVQTEVLKRIHDRTWEPGEIIPRETDLAYEFGCARVTVNRALRALADKGVLDRKRKVGTTVALYPTSKATLKIPLIRKEIEDLGKVYSYKLLKQTQSKFSKEDRLPTHLSSSDNLLYIEAIHFSDGEPFVIESRYINQKVVTNLESKVFEKNSPNEWLLANVPYTHGAISFSATNCSAEKSTLLKINPSEAVFQIDRTTFDREQVITNVLLTYHKDYQLQTSL